MNSHQNRAILLTPPGPAAIAVLRLIGTRALEFLGRHFSREAQNGRCVHGNLTDGGEVIDDVLVVVHEGGVDLNLHGGPWVIQAAMDLARRDGFEVSTALEEAVEGDPLLEREILASLPEARTELAIRALLAQTDAWKSIAAGPSQGPGRSFDAILEDRALFHLLHPPKVAIVGVPNAGKSTLANQLFAQERSITADLPGTTRDWVGEIANIDGLAVMLVDTPGVRETEDPIERQAIDRSQEQLETADLVLILLDPTQKTEEQEQLLARLPAAMAILNKSDVAAQPSRLDGQAHLRISASTGQGVDELRRLILHHFQCEALDVSAARLWTSRHLEIVKRCGSVDEAARKMLE